MLQEYCSNKQGAGSFPGSSHALTSPSLGKMRFGRLLLLLPVICVISARSIETLFFKRTVGNISVERVIGDLFQNS